MKYYAVKVGLKTGIYTNWEDCKKQVNGYKGAIYKSFSTLADAENFLTDNDSEKNILNLNKENENYAYVDGSYDNEKKIYGSGIVIITPSEKITQKIASNNEDIRELRNVAGEIEAVKYVLNYCLENNLKEITIYYDYAGIEHWATGFWKTNLEYTKNYALFAQKIMDKIKVNFVKVKAHSGIELNELVDKLAKEAIIEFNVNKKENIDSEDKFIFGSEEDIELLNDLKNNN